MEPEAQKKQTPVVLIVVVVAALIVVGFVVLSVLAALIVPGLLRTQGRAKDVMCQNNLRSIYQAALLYSHETRSFPHSPEGSEAALNVLLTSPAGQGLDPQTFICPHTDDPPAEILGDSFRIDRDTTSYRIVADKLRPTGPPKILLVDKTPHPDGTHQAIFTDGRVRKLTEEEFQRDYVQLFR